MWGKNKNRKTSHGRTARVARLEANIAESRHLRALVRDPDLIAVTAETHRRKTLAGLWVFLVLGLAFTTEGVHRFLAGATTPADPLWWAAWGVEPMFAGLLIVLLNCEATLLSHGVDPASRWWTGLKWGLLACTLFMNVMPQITPMGQPGWRFHLGSFFVHAAIPVLVFCLAEVIPVMQARIRTVILNGYTEADAATTLPAQAEQDPEDTPARNPRTPEHERNDSPELEAVSSPADQPSQEKESTQDSTDDVASASSIPSTRLRSTVDSAPKAAPGPKLPPQLMEAIRTAYRTACEEGREFTTADVQQVVKLPDQMAQQVLSSLVPPVVNGHAAA